MSSYIGALGAFMVGLGASNGCKNKYINAVLIVTGMILVLTDI